MDPELKTLIKENLALARETNELVHKMHSAQKWARFLRLLYWLVLIGISVGAFYYLSGPLQTLIDTYRGLLGGFEKAQQGVSSFPDTSTFQNLLDKVRP
ncbi:MAG: hypothetical protein Q8Q36_00900 [bacterium]|nr:hypothetical protein [bacterium]